jgi:hypothetical protein
MHPEGFETIAIQVAHKSMMSKKKKKSAICYNLAFALARPSHN